MVCMCLPRGQVMKLNILLGPKQNIIYVGHLVFLARNILSVFYNLCRMFWSRGGIINHGLETHRFME